MEPCQQQGARENHDRAQHDRAEHTNHQHALPLFVRYGEVGEHHQEDEDVFDGQ